jgi:hypothetical protein
MPDKSHCKPKSLHTFNRLNQLEFAAHKVQRALLCSAARSAAVCLCLASRNGHRTDRVLLRNKFSIANTCIDTYCIDIAAG